MVVVFAHGAGVNGIFDVELDTFVVVVVVVVVVEFKVVSGGLSNSVSSFSLTGKSFP